MNRVPEVHGRMTWIQNTSVLYFFSFTAVMEGTLTVAALCCSWRSARSFVRLSHLRSPLLLSFTTGCLQSTHVTVRPAVGAAYLLLRLAAADAFSGPGTSSTFPRGRNQRSALHAFAAGRIVFAATGLVLSGQAHLAAVTPVQDEPTGATEARAQTDVAPGGALLRARGSGQVVRQDEWKCKKK